MPLILPPALSHPGYLAGRWYLTAPAQRAAVAIGAVDTLYFYPFYIFAPVAVTALGVRSTAGGAGSSVKTGIWRNDPTVMRPSGAPVIVDDTGIATTGTGELTITTTGNLTTGWYWAGTKFTGTLPTMAVVNTVDGMAGASYFMGMAAQAALTTNVVVFAHAYATAMPNISTAQAYTETSQNACLVAFKS